MGDYRFYSHGWWDDSDLEHFMQFAIADDNTGETVWNSAWFDLKCADASVTKMMRNQINALAEKYDMEIDTEPDDLCRWR